MYAPHQEQMNAMMKALVDNAQLQNKSMMMCNNALPPGPQNVQSGLYPGKVWHTSGNQPGSMVDSPPRVAELVMARLPAVCKEYIHHFDHTVKDGKVYAKWTFRNDQSVVLKAVVDVDETAGKANLRAIDDDFDFEEWAATAIMVCDAGEEVWERPKAFSAASSGMANQQQQSATQARAMQQASSQQMQSALAGLSGSFTTGLLQGLGQSMFGGK